MSKKLYSIVLCFCCSMLPRVLFDTSALQSRAKAHQLPSFKVKQIFFELFKNQHIHWEEMTTLSKDLKADLAETFVPLSLSVVETVSTDTTTKFAFQTHDGHLIEAILMLHRQDEKYAQHAKNHPHCVAGRKLNRITLCISSQVGCPVNCLFCVTGKLGFTRNLTRDEIISQILYANWWIKKQFGKKEDGSLRAVRNVVFMGMGEPLLNYEQVVKSIEIMLAQDRLSLGRRHITISTAGIVPGIQRLIADRIEVKLAISLHAPRQALREQLIPIAKTYPLDQLMTGIDKYVAATDNRIFYEYIMIKGVTDTPELAHELVTLLAGKLAHVNLIPYNPNPVIDFLESSVAAMQQFKQLLEKGGLTVTVRESMGRDTKGACGQLGREKVKTPSRVEQP